jgi:TRAP-type C4-dicarboxylate transport system substrate-binding protein
MTRSLWCKSALALALLVAAAAPVQAQTQAPTPPILLKFSQFLGPTSFFQLDVVEPWAHELEARTGGKVKIEIHDGSSPLGQVTAQASQVQAGAVDIALGLRGAEGDRFPASSIVELPFVVPNAAIGSRALWTLAQDGPLADDYKDFKLLALFVHNPGLIHTAAKRVVVLDDIKGLRLRAANRTVAAALEQIGARPAVLQVNDVMPAVQAGQLDGIVTNWGNPLVGFNDYMKFHTEVQFYSSAFFIVMNRARYDGLPADVRGAIDAISGAVWVAKFGAYWDKWDAPVRAGADAPGHEIIRPDQAAMAGWKAGLKPVTERYLAALSARVPQAQAAYARLIGLTGGGN